MPQLILNQELEVDDGFVYAGHIEGTYGKGKKKFQAGVNVYWRSREGPEKQEVNWPFGEKPVASGSGTGRLKKYQGLFEALDDENINTLIGKIREGNYKDETQKQGNEPSFSSKDYEEAFPDF